MCKLHQMEMEFYCQNCNVSLCQKCVNTKGVNFDHSKHDVITQKERKKSQVYLLINSFKKEGEINETVIGQCQKEITELEKRKEEQIEKYNTMISFTRSGYEKVVQELKDFILKVEEKIELYFTLKEELMNIKSQGWVSDSDFNTISLQLEELKKKNEIRRPLYYMSSCPFAYDAIIPILEKEKDERDTHEPANDTEDIIGFNNYKFIPLSKIHIDNVTSVCLIGNLKIASSSYDKTIKIYNLATYKCEDTLEGHTLPVTYISLVKEECLISASVDKTVKLWLINSIIPSCIATFVGHTDIVWKAIELNNEKFASCSSDKTIKIWDSSLNCIKTLTGHSKQVNSIIQTRDRKYIVSANSADDNTLRFWNSETYDCEEVLQDVPCCFRNNLCEINKKIFVGGKNVISVVDCLEKKVEKKIKFPERSSLGYITSFIQINENTLLCGGENGLSEVNIANHKIYPYNQPQPLQITGLVKINVNKFLCCSKENIILFWKE